MCTRSKACEVSGVTITSTIKRIFIRSSTAGNIIYSYCTVIGTASCICWSCIDCCRSAAAGNCNRCREYATIGISYCYSMCTRSKACEVSGVTITSTIKRIFIWSSTAGNIIYSYCTVIGTASCIGWSCIDCCWSAAAGNCNRCREYATIGISYCYCMRTRSKACEVSGTTITSTIKSIFIWSSTTGNIIDSYCTVISAARCIGWSCIDCCRSAAAGNCNCCREYATIGISYCYCMRTRSKACEVSGVTITSTIK